MQITQEYLEGIKEGRAYLLKFQPDIQRMQLILRSIERALTEIQAESPSGAVADLLRGERDFWRNQIKKA
jgi:hypothetical protein